MKRMFLFLLLTACAPLAWAGDHSIENRIGKAMVGDHRSEASIERNQYRHPLETLTFFGLEDGMTVMEIWPGGGWYTDILAPVMNGHGAYIAASWDVDVPDQPGYRYRLDTALKEKFAADPELYGEPAVVGFSPPQSASLGEADAVDMVLTFRNTHGWVTDGVAESVYAEFARVLKPGGRLVINAIRKEAGDRHLLADLSYERHLWMEKEIKSVANVSRRDVREFLSLAAEMGIKPEFQEFALEEANQALVELKSRKIRGAKVLRIE